MENVIALWLLPTLLVVSFVVKVMWKTTFRGAARRLGGQFKAHPVKVGIGWVLGILAAWFVITSLDHFF